MGRCWKTAAKTVVRVAAPRRTRASVGREKRNQNESRVVLAVEQVAVTVLGVDSLISGAEFC